MLHDDDRPGSPFEPIGPNDDGWPATLEDLKDDFLIRAFRGPVVDDGQNADPS